MKLFLVASAFCLISACFCAPVGKEYKNTLEAVDVESRGDINNREHVRLARHFGYPFGGGYGGYGGYGGNGGYPYGGGFGGGLGGGGGYAGTYSSAQSSASSGSYGGGFGGGNGFGYFK